MPSSRMRKSLPLYLIPIVVGVGGIVFSQQLEPPWLRAIVVLLSVAAPLFAGGNILARLQIRGPERAVLIGGLILLVVGASVPLSGFSQSLIEAHDVPPAAGEAARWIGLGSLLLGVFAIVFIAVRADEAIDHLAGRFRQLASHMSEGFVLTDYDGAIAMVNQRFLEMAGLPEREVMGQDIAAVSKRLGVDPVLPSVRSLGTKSREYRVSWFTGGEERQCWVSGAPVYSPRGRLTGMLLTLRDITEEARLSDDLEKYSKDLQRVVNERTRQLRQSEEQLRDLLMHMNEGFVTLDSRFHVHFANDRIAEMLDTPPAEILGRDLFDFVDTASQAKLLDLFPVADAGEVSRVNQELNFIARGRVLLPVMVGVAPIRDQGAPDLRYSLVVTDISELKQMQRELEERAAQLESANQELRMLDRAKDAFLSNVTHELRTPLTSIRGYIDSLAAGGGDESPEERRKAVEVMDRNAQRLNALIDEMIEFSRMQVRGVQLTLSLLDPGRTADECVRSALPQARDKGVALETDWPARLPLIWGDQGKLGQVLTILLNNAIKFTGESGRIKVSLRETGNNGFEIAVSDTGIGIDRANHEKIFDKFFQVDSNLNRRYEGAGIGLSIAKSIIQAHGGDIFVDSEPGEGSTFTCVLPKAVFGEEWGGPEAQAPSGAVVVFIAADPLFRSSAGRILEQAGWEVYGVSNVFEGVRTARDVMPDVICVDRESAVAGGGDSVEKIREEPDLNDTPLLAVYAPAKEIEVAAGPETAGGAPVTHWLAKPFSANAFTRALEDVYAGESPGERDKPAEETYAGRRKPRVLVVDSDPDFLEWVETVLRRRGIHFRGATNLEWALTYAREFHPDVIVAEADSEEAMNDGLLQELLTAEETRATPVFAMSCVHRGPEELGPVAGVLRKPFTHSELAERIAASREEEG